MPDHTLDTLIQLLSKCPGLGARSARRLVLHLLKQRETLLQPLIKQLADAAEHMQHCSECGNLDTSSPCQICVDPRRDRGTICVVEDVADVWAFERGGIFRGVYHVLGGTLSALDGRGPSELRIDALVSRASSDDIHEVIIATNATVDGQTTAHYISETLKNTGVTISRLAHGIPVGGELDYLDDGTLIAALNARLAV